MKVIEYLQGGYAAQEEPFGVVYRWSPERVVIECKCGARPTLTASMTTCSGCGLDHGLFTRREFDGSRMTVDEVLHPWRYVEEEREGAGLPF